MIHWRVLLVWASLFCPVPLLNAQTGEVSAMLKNSVETWNRGDLAAFVSDYAGLAETTYVGREVVRGPKAILERYQKNYPNREAMGTLRFANMEIRELAPALALVIGEYHLKRTVKGGGDASGRYTLLLRKIGPAWKIIHDHSSPN